ncbi:tea3 [Symbiodinium sp. CCMP2592]|nr:tea3 [Symbiodinium sp. CCMP2592]
MAWPCCVYLLVATVAAVPSARRDHAGAASDNGDVLWFFGGKASTDLGRSLVDELWSYDIDTGNWTFQSQGTGPPPRDDHVAVHAAGVVWIHGGWGGASAGRLNDLWAYNVSVKRWNLISNLAGPSARYGHVAVYAFGSLWLHGGNGMTDLGTSLLDELWSYDVETGNWTFQSKGEGPSPRVDHVAVYAEGVIWVHGGWGGSDAGQLNDLWSFHISGGQWSLMNSSEGPASRSYHGVASSGGLIWIHGGWGGSEAIFDDVWSYNPESGSWALRSSGARPPKRISHAAVYAAGKLWIHGGYDWDGDQYLSDLWSLDMNTVSWQVPGNAVSLQEEHGLVNDSLDQTLHFLLLLPSVTLMLVCFCGGRLCCLTTSRRSRWSCKQVGCRMVCRSFIFLLAVDRQQEFGSRPFFERVGSLMLYSVLLGVSVPSALSWGRMLAEGTDFAEVVLQWIGTHVLLGFLVMVCFDVGWLSRALNRHERWEQFCSLSDPLYLAGSLLHADVRLVRLEYLQELVEAGHALPRRQEAEHATVKSTGQTALVSHAEMLAWAAKMRRTFSLHMASPIIVVSHCWETREHPDPWGYQLETIVRSLQKLQREWSHEILGVFIDYTCLYQFKRKRRHEEESFRAAMKNMSLLYAHEWTQTLCVIDQTPESHKNGSAGSIPVYCPDEDEVQDRPITSLVPNTTDYELRGWCLAELQWSSLRASELYRNPLHPSSALPNQHLWARRSPMAPYKFRSELAKKEIKFTHRSDFAPLIEAQQTAFDNKARQCHTLGFWDLPANEVEILGEAVYFFPNVHTLKLERCAANVEGFIRNLSFSGSLKHVYMRNAEIGDAEAKVIAGFLPSSKWKAIGLADNRIGDEGAADLAGALELMNTLSMEGLQQTRFESFLMDLTGNRISESGVAGLEAANSQQVVGLKIGGQRVGHAAGSDGQAADVSETKSAGLRATADVSVAVAEPPGCIADPSLL